MVDTVNHFWSLSRIDPQHLPVPPPLGNPVEDPENNPIRHRHNRRH